MCIVFDAREVSMNSFIKSLLVKFLKDAEPELQPKLASFLVVQGDKLLDGVIQPGSLRTVAEKFLADNAALVANLVFEQGLKFLEAA
jgi:hypothetical protein